MNLIQVRFFFAGQRRQISVTEWENAAVVRKGSKRVRQVARKVREVNQWLQKGKSFISLSQYRHSFTLTCSNAKAQNMRAMYTKEMYCLRIFWQKMEPLTFVFFRIQSSLPEYYCFTLDSSYYCSYGKISDHFPWIVTPEQLLIHLLQRRKGAVLRILDQKLNFCEKKRESCFNTEFNVTYKFHDKLGTMWLERTNLSEGP